MADDNDRKQSISEQVAEIIAETIEELSLMTMGYPDNQFLSDETDETIVVVQMTDRWADRYTPFHKEFFQDVSKR